MRTIWNKFSLRLRLFLSFGVLLALMITLSLVLQSTFYAQNRVTRLLEQDMPTQLQQLSAEVTLKLAPSIEAAQSLATNTYIKSWVKNGMPASELPLVQEQMAAVYKQLDAEAVFLASNDSEHVRYYYLQEGGLKQRQILPGVDQDAWYFNYINSNLSHELNQINNDFTGGESKTFISYKSIEHNAAGHPISVAGIGLNMNNLEEIINAYRFRKNGRASLVNQQGHVQVSAADSFVSNLSATPRLQALLDKKDAVIEEIDYKGQQLFIGTLWIADLQSYLVIEVPRSDFIAPIKALLYQSLMIGALLLFISLLLLYPLAISLTRPLALFQRQLGTITRTLDLSQRVETTDQAELGELAAQTNSLLERLSFAINGVQNSSNRLTDTAHNLAYTAGLVSHNTDKQQEVSQSMAAAVEEMSSSVAEITSTMEELSASSTQIADYSQSVVDVANITLESSKKGAGAMQNLQSRMAEIHKDSEHSLDEIVQLGRKSKEISKVMDLINTLADQTKLIAFNAALEASSAGESGKRFSVVASEIRRLADSVTDSTHEIEDRIQEIQDAINRLVITSEKGASSIEMGMQVSSETAQDLNALVQAASKTSSAAQQISMSTRQQKTASSQVVTALRDIANASMYNAQSVRSITDISEDMIHMSGELNQLVSEFKTAKPDQ
ncbi:MAG TPA: methyl-accepting chemotaxis protein [Thiopseudomonas sp.]|nr:methyl-accepting chemotaxis protein [Thiopseudomonas sp.]